MKKFYLKTLLWFFFNLICISISGQTPEVYAYICNYAVNTGTGERRLFDSPLYFYCRYNSDKSICFETHADGTLQSDNDYKNPYLFGAFNSKGRFQYKFSETSNGVKIFIKKYSYYEHRKWGSNGWEYYDYKEDGPFYMYASPDYNRINFPMGKTEVFVYERFFPDQPGRPSQIW